MVSIEILKQVHCFQSLEMDQLESIARSGELRSLPKDEFLFHEGDHADAMYILLSGLLAVSLADANGRRLQLAVIEPGTCLGEMGLSQDAARSADASAMCDAVLLQIHRSQFDVLVREQPVFVLSLLADLSKKLHDSNRRLENRVTLSVKERLWLALDALAESGKIYPAPKVTHLAIQIDATREMTSKALSQLIREKRVKKETTRLWLVHPPQIPC